MAITIFALGLVLLISQVPMLFAPLQTVSTDIQPTAGCIPDEHDTG